MILPTPARPFAWHSFDGLTGLVCEPLDQVAAHLFTTIAWPLGARTSVPNDEEWTSVAAALGVPDERLVRLRQVHGTGVIMGKAPRNPILPDGDIVITREQGTAAAVQAADCVPLLVADPVSGAIAAVHAGWRGLAARAPQAAVAALVQTFGCRGGDLIAAIGPSIGACCYEVGSDVLAAFRRSGFEESNLERWFQPDPGTLEHNPTMAAVRGRERRPDRRFFDGWSAARAQLVESGVADARIFTAALCTASHPDVFCSYRRDGAPSGRIAGAIRCGSPRP